MERCTIYTTLKCQYNARIFFIEIPTIIILSKIELTGTKYCFSHLFIYLPFLGCNRMEYNPLLRLFVIWYHNKYHDQLMMILL